MLVFLLHVGILLSLALVLGRLAVRVGLPAVVGELLVGVLVGPSILGQAVPDLSQSFVEGTGRDSPFGGIGQLGVLLLVGITGVGIDLALLRRRAPAAVSVGLPALIVPLGMGVAAGLLLPAALLPDQVDRGVAALFLGVAMGISALPVTAKILLDMKLFHRNVGQLTLLAAALDDVAGWVLLSLVSVLASIGVHGLRVTSFLYPLVFVLAAVLIARPVVRFAMRFELRSGDTAAGVAVAVVVILLSAAAAEALGMDAAFGAFVGGLLLGSAGPSVGRKLAPLRTLTLAVLAPLFFATAGLRVDVTGLAEPMVLVMGVVLLLIAIVGKFAGAYIGARISKLSPWEAIAVGAGMNARGVVEIVVASVGLQLGVLTPEMYTIIIVIAIVTSVMAPPILRYAMAKVEHTPEEQRRELELALYTAESAETVESVEPAESAER